VRFVNYERYRAMSENQIDPNAKRYKQQEEKVDRSESNLLKTQVLSIDFFLNGSIDTISKPEKNDDVFDKPIVVENIIQPRRPSTSAYNNERFPFKNLKPTINFDKGFSTKSLGVFSDTKIYSAFIKAELEKHNVDIRYFNHPRTFLPQSYALFDSVSAWIVFLSDDCDGRFLDSFINRYFDKPTLFLCPKTKRSKTTQKINEFITTLEVESAEL